MMNGILGISGPALGPEPIAIMCPSCCVPVLTEIEHVNGCLSGSYSAFLCAIGCFMGCCLIPLCMKRLKDVRHYCPECGYIINVYQRI